jgi:hypothetical protein
VHTSRVWRRLLGVEHTVIESVDLEPDGRHCCIEAKGVLAMDQSSEADPSGTLQNCNKLGI